MRMGKHRIAIDVGGTFTDLVVSNADGSARTLKLLSTPDDYSRAITDGLGRLFDGGATDPKGVVSLVHAFTVATNALLTGKGTKVALIITRGFRDVLEIARLRMPQLYNMDWDKPRPLVPRRLRFEIEERMDADGQVVQALDAQSVIAAIDRMRGQRVDSVAVCLLHSYINPAHEQVVMELLRQHAPELSISASHQVLPEIREYSQTGVEEAVLQVRSDRQKFQPFGLKGGNPGANAANRLHELDGTQTALPGKFMRTFKRGERYRAQLAGGGGWGDAFTRAPDLVWQDVLDEKVSRESAAKDYGVVIGEDGALDVAATDRLRASRKAAE